MAAQAMYQDRDLQARAKRDAGGDGKDACKRLNDLVDEAAARDALRPLIQGGCAISSSDIGPGLRTDPDCNQYVMLPGQPANDPGLPLERKDAHSDRDVGGCSEFLDAAYDHEDYHRAQCKSNRASRLQPKVRDFAAEEVAAYQVEIDSLKAKVQSWRRSCADTAAAEQAQRDLDAAVSSMQTVDARKQIKDATRPQRPAGRR
jgi:hypothetical protein